jgi:hypothetical protein
MLKRMRYELRAPCHSRAAYQYAEPAFPTTDDANINDPDLRLQH